MRTYQCKLFYVFGFLKIQEVRLGNVKFVVLLVKSDMR